MFKIIRTLNLKRETTSILENAYNIGYEKEVNAIWSASFSLPLNDPKVHKVEMLEYVEIEDNLYRIMPKETSKSSNSVTFECEHVLSTLLDACLFKYHQLTNYKTSEVIEYLLSQQEEKHWELRRCDFDRRFHYSWENENGLVAPLFSVPKPFDEPYMWTFDTSTYPWKLDLIKPSKTPTGRIKEGYNLRSLDIEENPNNKINRIYPLGAGEGINKLTIESVNNGVPFIEDRAPGEEIIKYIWVDQRYTVAESLKADGKSLLDKWKKPIVVWSASAADVSSITGLSIDKLECGAVVRLEIDNYPATDLRIMKEKKSDITGSPGDVQLEIGNVVEDLATTGTDIERRQQINEMYSQGATNILNADRTDNADPEHPIKFKLRIPEDAININFMELTWDTDYFRGYTKGSKAGGHYEKSSTVQSKSTAGGGAYTKDSTVTSKSTASGGGTSKSTQSGGGTTRTSEAGGNHRHVMFVRASETAPDFNKTMYEVANGGYVNLEGNFTSMSTYGSSGNHSHSTTFPAHTHDFTTPNHTHDFTVTIPGISIPNHTHGFEVTIPAINIPDHTHDQIYGIYEHNKKPNSLEIKVDGTVIPETSLSGNSIDLIPYLQKDNNDKVARGRFAVVEIKPVGEIAQISANVIWGLFIQSQKGGKF